MKDHQAETIPQYLNYKMIGERLGLSRKTIQHWVSKDYRDFPKPLYLGRNALFREADVNHWLNLQMTDKISDEQNPYLHRDKATNKA